MRALICFILGITFTMLSFQTVNAQCTRWKKNHNFWQFRTGIGITPTFVKDHATAELPPVSLELRYWPNPKFSIGLLAGNSISTVTQKHHSGTSQTFRNDFRMLAVRAAVHTQRWEKWKAYGGILLAYQHNKVESTGPGKYPDEQGPIHYTPRNTGLFYSAFIGTAYQPVPQIELFGELSYGLSILTVGAGFSW